MKIWTFESRNFHRQHSRNFHDLSRICELCGLWSKCRATNNTHQLHIVLRWWKFLECCRWKFLETKVEIFISPRIFLWLHRTNCGQFGDILKWNTPIFFKIRICPRAQIWVKIAVARLWDPIERDECIQWAYRFRWWLPLTLLHLPCEYGAKKPISNASVNWNVPDPPHKHFWTPLL